MPSIDYEHLPHAYRMPEREQQGSTVVQQPRCVFIEATNQCNLLCKTCPRTFVTYETTGILTWESFVRIVGQFPEMERAVLHGIGEPLLNKNLPRMIDYLKARHVTVLFNTNAALLTASWSHDLIASGLDELRVSVDAADPETYELIRGAPLLQRVLENLKRFTQLQGELNAEKPHVSIWMTGMRENIAQLPALVKLAAQVGVPEVYMQRMVYYLDSDSPPGLMKRGHALFDDLDETVDHAIAEAESVAHQLGLNLRASGATNPRRSLEASRKPDSQPWSACLRPWTSAYVTANGNCLPCCIGPFASTNYEGLRMGNLFEQDFTHIWNNERYRAWRLALLSQQPHPSCKGCGVFWSL